MNNLELDISRQPDGTTCGPTCLHAVYGFYGDSIALERVIDEVHVLEGGGTLGVLLAVHALRRGFRATIYSYNLQLFDPTWFGLAPAAIAERLRVQARVKEDPKLRFATYAYLEFLDLGGHLRFEDLSESLVARILAEERPLLTGLSSTYLYRDSRPDPTTGRGDDVRGQPEGHFVVLCGYDRERRTVRVADPLETNPISRSRQYDVGVDRLIGAIFLGIITYDANLVVLEPDSTGS